MCPANFSETSVEYLSSPTTAHSVPCDLDGESTRRPFAGESFGANRVSRYCVVYSEENRSKPAGAAEVRRGLRALRVPTLPREAPLTAGARKGHSQRDNKPTAATCLFRGRSSGLFSRVCDRCETDTLCLPHRRKTLN